MPAIALYCSITDATASSSVRPRYLDGAIEAVSSPGDGFRFQCRRMPSVRLLRRGAPGAVTVERGRRLRNTCSVCPSGVLRHPITRKYALKHEHRNGPPTCTYRDALEL